MLLEVYRYALKNRDTKVKQIMDSNYNGIVAEAKSRWIGYEPRLAKCTTAGIDSSWNKRAFQGLNLYAVDAVAVTSTNQILEVEYEVDIAESARNELLESKAMAMEASVASKAIGSGYIDLIMIDGSIIPRLRGKTRISALDLVKKIGSERSVLISKSSESRAHFGSLGSRAGDIYYYGQASKNVAGYSQPNTVLLEGVAVTEVYARFRNDTPIVRIELLGHASKDRILELLDKIAYRSISGYPYCLKCAHVSCKISDDDIDRLTAMFSMRHVPGARSVLNE